MKCFYEELLYTYLKAARYIVGVIKYDKQRNRIRNAVGKKKFSMLSQNLNCLKAPCHLRIRRNDKLCSTPSQAHNLYSTTLLHEAHYLRTANLCDKTITKFQAK